MVLKKAEIEASLQEEQQLIQSGKLKEDNPLDLSQNFARLCEACRRGDLKGCQEVVNEGVNINARDRFDYTPLILASLCGHFEVVQLLLEAGALCERDTFQGERCLYNALNDRIRNLLLSYDYSKSTDPLQPLAAHINSLLTREHPRTFDIEVTAAGSTFRLHKFILSARSPYFSNKLSASPDTASWKLPPAIPPQSFEIAIKHIYLGEIPSDVGGGPGTGHTEEEVLEGIDKITRQLEVRNLWDGILESGDRRLARQRKTDEIEKGQAQLEAWFTNNVLRHTVITDTSNADKLRWDRNNGIFADVLLRADEGIDKVAAEGAVDFESSKSDGLDTSTCDDRSDSLRNIPIGPSAYHSRPSSRERSPQKSFLFPVHRAMLLRSEFFMTMFSSGFREAQETEYLQIVPIDCSPDVLKIVLRFLYTEKAVIPLDLAIDVLFAADLLLMERLKLKAAVVVSTLGSGGILQIPARLDASEDTPVEQNNLNIYDVIRAGWLTRVPRLEEFGSRYIAYRLESYIDEEEFSELVTESAQRIKGRQETDTIELLDDIRYYLSERFRLRFEESGFEQLMDEEADMVHEDNSINVAENKSKDEAVHTSPATEKDFAVTNDLDNQMANGTIRTLDGELAGDELEGDAINYQILLGKIDNLLDRLKLDA